MDDDVEVGKPLQVPINVRHYEKQANASDVAVTASAEGPGTCACNHRIINDAMASAKLPGQLWHDNGLSVVYTYLTEYSPCL